MQMHIVGFLLVYVVPLTLAVMNLVWFGKILKGLKKTLAKRKWLEIHHHLILNRFSLVGVRGLGSPGEDARDQHAVNTSINFDTTFIATKDSTILFLFCNIFVRLYLV